MFFTKFDEMIIPWKNIFRFDINSLLVQKKKKNNRDNSYFFFEIWNKESEIIFLQINRYNSVVQSSKELEVTPTKKLSF